MRNEVFITPTNLKIAEFEAVRMHIKYGYVTIRSLTKRLEFLKSQGALSPNSNPSALASDMHRRKGRLDRMKRSALK